MQPRFPIYVISKGRWESPLTAMELNRLSVPYLIVVEPQERRKYESVIVPEKILVAPEDFSKRGQGSIPVRNFVWEHAIESGAEWHWIMDDNIRHFWRLNHNLRIRVADGTIFYCAEDFTLRYENIGQAGLNYFMFCPDRTAWPSFRLNTRVYSCILIRNDLPFRWRGRYNEDTDLSIRILKSGLCTILFNAFLAYKETTGTTKGGNMEQLYSGDWIEKRRLMAQSLVDQHPDITTITEKWGRPQHQVDYSRFKKNQLLRKPGWSYTGVDDYGMKLITVTPQRLVGTGKKSKLIDEEPPELTGALDEKWDDYWADRGFARDPRADIQEL